MDEREHAGGSKDRNLYMWHSATTGSVGHQTISTCESNLFAVLRQCLTLSCSARVFHIDGGMEISLSDIFHQYKQMNYLIATGPQVHSESMSV